MKQASNRPATRAQPDRPHLEIPNIVAVASGKGGVGKSTVTANLALALVAEGARVGLVDADIYGPSLAQAFGYHGHSSLHADSQPIFSHGLHYVSIACFVDTTTPMVWRGPMATNALQQLLFKTQWPELDYLLIDMPPGTGDIALTLSQRVALSGAVVVTTPQDLALLDAQKAIEMFVKVAVPTLGIIENMSVYQCSQCGHQEALFGEGGGDRLSQQYGVPVLAQIPLHICIRQHMDQGVPTMVAEPESQIARLYRIAAQQMQLAIQQQSTLVMPEIVVSED